MIADATTAETVLDDINRMNAAREGLAVLVQHSIDRGQDDAAARYLHAADRGTEELAHSMPAASNSVSNCPSNPWSGNPNPV